MSDGYEAIAGGINNFLKFYAGYLEGKELRKEKDHQDEMRNLIQTAVQSYQIQPGFSIGPTGKITQRYTPTRTKSISPIDYESPEQQRLRIIYGLEPATPEQIKEAKRFTTPIVEGGYVIPTPGESAEYLPGYTPEELAPRAFEREFAAPIRERFEREGYRPKITGYERIKEKKPLTTQERNLIGQIRALKAKNATIEDIKTHIKLQGYKLEDFMDELHNYQPIIKKSWWKK